MTDRTENVLTVFEQISSVPRKSGNRGPIRDWITAWAEEQGFPCRVDGYDNILISVPASPGYEGKPVVILQGHSDMVCEKTPSSDHDFDADPLDLYREGEWLKARDTTLGADNGIALAIAFDVAVNTELAHPPLEILVTSDEEIGLDGANALEPGFLSGSTLINLDSEEEGYFTVGCAGGNDCFFDLEGEWEQIRGIPCEIILDGLSGGHSGMDINKGKGSALVIMGRVLSSLLGDSVRLANLESGSGATNAIARRAEALLVVGGEKIDFLKRELARWEEILKGELDGADSALKFTLSSGREGEYSCLSVNSARSFTDLIVTVPHGVMALSREIEGLVETSANLAAVIRKEGAFHFRTSQRSSVMSRLDEVTLRTEAAARQAGCANIVRKNKYPAWQPDWDSPLLRLFSEIYRGLFGKEPVVEVIHAGLETGVIGSKYRGMDMISLGPTILNPHSPDERLLIPSLKDIYSLISAVLKEI